MLRKAVASLLLLLAASPFTAPFATCDVFTLLGERNTAIQAQYQTPGSSIDDPAQSVAMASTFHRNRIRHNFGSRTPAIPVVGCLMRTGSLSLADASHSATALATSDARLTPLRI